jgi:predicted esterase
MRFGCAGLLLMALAPCRGETWTTAHFKFHHRKIALESSCASAPEHSARAAIIFLHGSGGPDPLNLPYRFAAAQLARDGYCVAKLHFLDATSGAASDPERHYGTWVTALEQAIVTLHHIAGAEDLRVFAIGYSLGASIVLADSATHPAEFAGVVSISGSLPDANVSRASRLPPLLMIHGEKDSVIPVRNAQQLVRLCRLTGSPCKLMILPAEGHAFTEPAKIAISQAIEKFVMETPASFGSPPVQ